ncbi:MAG: hypothetical protein NC218_04140 [Acetobacter sp.]|nr:hypothetical protein [Acetobacter sp.]
MKKFFGMLAFAAIASLLASCGEEKKVEPTPAPEPVKEEVYQPQHQSTVVDLKAAKKYQYFNAPTTTPATSVVVNYNEKTPYAAPIEVKFSYENGDTYTYTIPAEFGLWKNQAGKFRVVSDNECTVWIQGQEKRGKFHEFVFYGDPKHNGTKIKPNSYRNLPAGEIRYRK